MSISSCPRCSQHVTLPEGVEHHARVRCPLCQAQYTLAEVLAERGLRCWKWWLKLSPASTGARHGTRPWKSRRKNR